MFLAVVLAKITFAAATPPTLEFTLSLQSLALSPNETVRVLLVARNPLSQTLNLKLSWVVDAPLTITTSTPLTATLPGFNDQSWEVAVTRSGDLPASVPVNFRLDYSTAAGAKNVVVQTLQVAPCQPDPLEKVAKLEVKSAIDLIWEQRQGVTYLIATNMTDSPLQAGPLQTSSPYFVRLVPQIPGQFTLQPLSSATIPITVSVGGFVQPGDHLLLYELPVTRNWKGRADTYILVGSQTVKVGVLGETELSLLLAVPILLFLPGFLAIVTANLWWLYRKPAEQKDRFPLKAKTEQFWVVAILISILATGLYPSWTWLILHGHSRNYLYGYGLVDLLLAWFLGCLLGTLAYWAYESWLHAYPKIRYPNESTPPLQVLKKLSHFDRKVFQHYYSCQQPQGNFFLLHNKNDSLAEWWLGSEIRIRRQDNLTPELEKQISNQLNVQGDLKILIPLLETALQQGTITLTQITPPLRAGKNSVSAACQSGPVVDWHIPKEVPAP